MRKLDNLKREGLITEAEFIKKRSEIMEQKW
ncbi:MAG TPA: SHOCT domain-containing protein [Candidatus Goldiibacteriota bacterium]|nr:SHOCT domain-containing protein [Candidatus Goldiibacteriota bacterium]